jgi:hypothetical protein
VRGRTLPYTRNTSHTIHTGTMIVGLFAPKRSACRPSDLRVCCTYNDSITTVLAVARHQLASRRRKSPIVMAAWIVPTAVLLAAGGVDYSLAAGGPADPVADEGAPCCMEIVAARPTALSSPPAGVQLVSSSDGGEMGSASRASRWRVVPVPQLLPVGIAPERGLQVNSILTARSISAAFPEIHEIGGVRQDALRWHPDGLALDVIIPNPGTAEGIALGNEIVAFVLKNATRFGIQDAIWRGTYYTPAGPQSSGAGHYDHVHVTTTGGGYPTGREVFLK